MEFAASLVVAHKQEHLLSSRSIDPLDECDMTQRGTCARGCKWNIGPGEITVRASQLPHTDLTEHWILELAWVKPALERYPNSNGSPALHSRLPEAPGDPCETWFKGSSHATIVPLCNMLGWDRLARNPSRMFTTFHPGLHFAPQRFRSVCNHQFLGEHMVLRPDVLAGRFKLRTPATASKHLIFNSSCRRKWQRRMFSSTSRKLNRVTRKKICPIKRV